MRVDEHRLVGEEARKSHALRLRSGFIDSYLSGGRILDIGYKGYLQDVVPIVPQATGVDLDYPGYDGRTLPFDDGSQDAVFASHCLEHIPDFGQALRDWFRVLKIGGFLVVVVPHQFLYEKRVSLPSRYNMDHRRFYTPAALMADLEAVLEPNSYRLRHLVDNDRSFDYSIPPDRHSGGCYEIELVIEKIAAPVWGLDQGGPALATKQGDFDALGVAETAEIVRERDGCSRRIRLVPGRPWDLAIFDFTNAPSGRRRILALQLGHFGDFVIGLPALRELRNAFPDDLIRLVVGAWNRDAAERSGLADEVATYDFFPEVARSWDGKPAQDITAFRAAVSGAHDVAVDLRVDEDTRPLLEFVDAGVRCGIGAAVRFPYLDVVLPYDHAARATETLSRDFNVLLGPERFHSRMPVQTSFTHETDFSVTDRHLIYGPYVRLPVGRFRAIFGLRVSGLRVGLSKVEIGLDVARAGNDTVVGRQISAARLARNVGDDLHLDFTNGDQNVSYEFRVHARGRPLRARLAFSGVRLHQLETPAAPRFRAAELHIGEQLSLLVRLLVERTRPLYLDGAAQPKPERTRGPRVVVAPASNSDLRDWPVGHYASLTRMLVDRLDCDIVLTGLREQSGAIAHIAQASGVGDRITNLAGRTAWADVPALLRGADLVICNNSGIAHLAASLGARTLAIYSASHQPQEWGPRGPRSRALMAVVPCSPCGFDRLKDCPHDHACMQDLSPETVFEQARAWLSDA